MELSYVGTDGRHMLRQPNINYADLTQVAANPGISTNAFLPFPGYTSITQTRSDGAANYNALQAYVSRRVGALQMTAGYTWSKSLGDSSSESDNSENWTVRHYNYGPTSFDRRNAFFSTFVWQLTRLEGHNAFLRTAAGGWQVSGVARLQSGQYYTITGNTATGARRADFIGGSSSVEARPSSIGSTLPPMWPLQRVVLEPREPVPWLGPDWPYLMHRLARTFCLPSGSI